MSAFIKIPTVQRATTRRNPSEQTSDRYGIPDSVIDINTIVDVIGLPRNDAGALTEPNNVVGCIYKDNHGGYWVQENLASRASWPISADTFFGSIGFAPAGQSAPKFVGDNPPVPKSNEAFQKCFSAASGGSLFG